MSSFHNYFSLLVMITLVHDSCGQQFNFSRPTSFSPFCGPTARWLVHGAVTLTSDDLKVYTPTIYVTAGSQDICTIDLSICPRNLRPPPGNAACHCPQRQGDDYSLYVSGPAMTSLSGQRVKVELRSQDIFNPVAVSTDLGALPDLAVMQASCSTNSVNVTSVNATAFNFSRPIDFSAFCGPPIKWTIQGSVKLTSDDLKVYQPTVYVTSESQDICSIDLSTCSQFLRPPPRDASCHCRRRQGDNYSFYVSGQPLTSLNGHTARLELHSIELGLGIVSFDLGTLPDLTAMQVSCGSSNYATSTSVTPPTTTLVPVSDLLTSDVCEPASNVSSSHLKEEVLVSGDHVVCDRHTDGGRWVVIQRRDSEEVDFYQGWDNYTQGFGSLQGNFWLGLEVIHRLCYKRPCQLRFDMSYNGSDYFAQYADFHVAGAADNYRLNIGEESGNTNDGGHAFSWNDNMEFTTFDRDHDKSNVVNCAQSYHGAWWYNSCTYVNPNGVWGRNSYSGVFWNPLTFDWITGRHSLSRIEMKVRRQH